MWGLDDIYATLTSLPSKIIVGLLYAILMPVLFPILYSIEILMNQFLYILNGMINLINLMIHIYNLYPVIQGYYYFYIPTIWAYPIYVGVLLKFYWGLLRFIKSWIPLVGGKG